MFPHNRVIRRQLISNYTWDIPLLVISNSYCTRIIPCDDANGLNLATRENLEGHIQIHLTKFSNRDEKCHFQNATHRSHTHTHPPRLFRLRMHSECKSMQCILRVYNMYIALYRINAQKKNTKKKREKKRLRKAGIKL